MRGVRGEGMSVLCTFRFCALATLLPSPFTPLPARANAGRKSPGADACWQPHGESNPGRMAENHLSWTTRRWGRTLSDVNSVSDSRGERRQVTEVTGFQRSLFWPLPSPRSFHLSPLRQHRPQRGARPRYRLCWLGREDSNPHRQIQSLQSCH